MSDSWSILRIDNRNDDTILYKLLQRSAGSYLYGESWQLNSGITKIVDEGEELRIHGKSGSCYIVYKTNECMRGIMYSILDSMNNIDGVTTTVIKYEDLDHANL